MDPETSMYAAISDLEDRIKSKQKDVLVLARAIRFQDNQAKKIFRQDQNGMDAFETEKQLLQKDSLQKQLK